VKWFVGLNPYSFPGSILKVEDVNFDAKDGRTRVPLYCWAVSAKRYLLFNIGEAQRPVLRKASAHGLGHLRAPYDATNPAKDIPEPAISLDKLGVERWQHDFWWLIAVSALSENPNRVNLKLHHALGQPAISRYAATSPKRLRWFGGFNEGLPYAARVKPFGFLHAMFAKGALDKEAGEEIIAPGKIARRRVANTCKPVAPYDKDLARAVERAFDRDTRLPVPVTALKSYREVITGYHMHPESKFRNGELLDRGTTKRRYVHAVAFQNIGKEANEWEEQFYLGYDEEEQIDYGLGPKSKKDFLASLQNAIDETGQRVVACRSGVSRRTIARLMEGHLPRGKVVAKIIRAVTQSWCAHSMYGAKKSPLMVPFSHRDRPPLKSTNN
jgi:hypothetical protein